MKIYFQYNKSPPTLLLRNFRDSDIKKCTRTCTHTHTQQSHNTFSPINEGLFTIFTHYIPRVLSALTPLSHTYSLYWVLSVHKDVNESQCRKKGRSCGWRVRENAGLMHYSEDSKQTTAVSFVFWIKSKSTHNFFLVIYMSSMLTSTMTQYLKAVLVFLLS